MLARGRFRGASGVETRAGRVVADVNRAIWIVENPEAVKKFPAAHVLVSGKFDAEKKMLHIEKIALVQ